jgi:hypothetical protein
MLKALWVKPSGRLNEWRRKLMNRVLLLALVPLWIAVLVYVTIPANIPEFQQAGCDRIVLGGHAGLIFWFPLFAFFAINLTWTILNSTFTGLLVLAWVVCIYLQRGAARKLMAEEGRWRLTATWWASSLTYNTVVDSCRTVVSGIQSLIHTLSFKLLQLSSTRPFTGFSL